MFISLTNDNLNIKFILKVSLDTIIFLSSLSPPTTPQFVKYFNIPEILYCTKLTVHFSAYHRNLPWPCFSAVKYTGIAFYIFYKVLYTLPQILSDMSQPNLEVGQCLCVVSAGFDMVPDITSPCSNNQTIDWLGFQQLSASEKLLKT